jgi:hypothetical protein
MLIDRKNINELRLSDRILFALDLALHQEDFKVAQTLSKALEMSMTRNTGGGAFVERRDYPPEIEQALDRMIELQQKMEG